MTTGCASPGATDLHTLAGQCGVAPLYHAVLERAPDELGKRLHNVTPGELYGHLATLKAHFRFVPVEEFVTASDRTGLACLSFDDGHKSVIEAALPVMVDLDIPATVFVNSASFGRAHLWRDKVRWLIEHDRVGEFERFMVSTQAVPGRSFYRYSKDRVNNSRQVETEIDRFLIENKIELDDPASCFDDESWLVAHELLSYGNHTESHYVLSSLPAEQQYEEIVRTRDFLRFRTGVRLCKVFAVPFGGSRDFDRDTLSIVAELGYEGIVLSRGRLNTTAIHMGGMPIADRFMPRGPAIADGVFGAYRDSVTQRRS